MISVSLDGDKKMVSNIGSSEILGEVIGEREETSDLSEVKTTSILKVIALGLFLLILGQRI
jgi:hypothetical protein